MPVEPNSRVVVDRVEWPNLVLFPRIVRAFTLASRPSRLVMSLAVIALLMVTGTLWDLVTGPTVSPAHPLYPLTAGETLGIFATTIRAIASEIDALAVALLGLNAVAFAEALTDLLVRLPLILWDTHPWFLIVFGLWSSGVLLVAGLMMSRSVACEFALDQVVEWPEAMAYALRRLPTVLLAVAYPTVVVVGGIGLLALGGLFFRLPGLDIIGALLYGPALIGGFIASVLIILTIGGVWLIPPAVAAESCDAPDALSRAYAYVKNKPLRLLAYLFLAIAVGLLGYIAYSGLAVMTMRFTAQGAAILGPEWMEEAIDEPAWLDPDRPMLALIARRIERAPSPAAVELVPPAPTAVPGSGLPQALPDADANANADAAVDPDPDPDPDPEAVNDEVMVVNGDTAPDQPAPAVPPIPAEPVGDADAAADDLSVTQNITRAIIGFWHTLIRGFVAAYVISYIVSASTVIYFLVRKLTDDQDLDEIWMPGLIEGTMAPGRSVPGP